MKIWFTSDTHFSAERTRLYSRRPFDTVEEMDEVLINNWNSVVGKDDIVYHLGDFGNYDIAKRLNGHINLVFGNYEEREFESKSFEEIKEEFAHNGINVVSLSILKLTLKEDNIELFLTHKPTDAKVIRDKTGVYTLFGHIHKSQMFKKFGLNVGIDCHNFMPIDLDTVKFYLNNIENHTDEEIWIQ